MAELGVVELGVEPVRVRRLTPWKVERLSNVTKQFGLPLSFMQDALEVAQGMRLEQALLAGSSEFKGLDVAAMIEQVPIVAA
jgi:hypothetical protein